MKDGNIKIIQTSRRRCFFRNEQPLMRFDVMNFEPHNFHNCSLTLEIAGIGIVGRRDIPKLNHHVGDLEFRIDTARLCCGSHLMAAVLECGGNTLVRQEFLIDVVPAPEPDRMEFWHWPSTVHYDALEAGGETAERELDKLEALGVTWSQFRAGWAVEHPDGAVALIEKAMKRGIRLGILIENTAGGIFRAGPDAPAEAHRINPDGSRSEFLNPYHPYTQEKARFLIRRLMALFAEFPACSSMFMNSELEDKLKLPCDPESVAHHEAAMGVKLSRLRSLERVFAESYPDIPELASGVVSASDPELKYARYYFEEGDGWTPINRLMAETARQARPDLATIADPLRLAPLPARFDGLGTVSSWTYTNPDPKLTLFVETLAAAARRGNREFIHTITLWNYAGTLTPCGSDRFAREFTLRMGPDRWKECAWINFSRGPQALGCYFGSPIEAFFEGGDPAIFSPATESAIAEFNREVLKPFGALARATCNLPRRAAVLDCFTSRVYGRVPRSHAHYQNYQIYDFYTVMNMAQIPADVIFEEDVLEGALERYELLALPAADTLPEPVYRRIVEFARRGGTVIADRWLQAEVPGVIRFGFDFSYRRNVNANAICRGRDFAVTDDTNFRSEWGGEVAADGVTADEDQRRMETFAAEMRERLDGAVRRDFDCSSPHILCNMRTGGRLRYLFAVNDRRTWDERSGKYRAMMEKGVPEHGVWKIGPFAQPPFVRELLTGQTPDCRSVGGGFYEFKLELPAAGGRIMAISETPPGELVLRAAPLPEAFSLDLRIKDGEDTVRPVRLDIYRPDGILSEYSGVRLVRDGVLSLTVPLAAGDPEGPWRIEAADLAGKGMCSIIWERKKETER
ncbi:hypothetical protein [Victivallis vadensis]|uniref:hypothetical protein n=1 Tax=Victivallis vadensis TaxID=172901 RepID=UPI0023F7A5BE|nr:hypothetical protein [Victivallis vadensis]